MTVRRVRLIDGSSPILKFEDSDDGGIVDLAIDELDGAECLRGRLLFPDDLFDLHLGEARPRIERVVTPVPLLGEQEAADIVRPFVEVFLGKAIGPIQVAHVQHGRFTAKSSEDNWIAIVDQPSGKLIDLKETGPIQLIAHVNQGCFWNIVNSLIASVTFGFVHPSKVPVVMNRPEGGDTVIRWDEDPERVLRAALAARAVMEEAAAELGFSKMGLRVSRLLDGHQISSPGEWNARVEDGKILWWKLTNGKRLV